MTFQPTGDRVFLTLDHDDKVTDSGIVVPARVLPIPNQGKVVAVGPGDYDKKGNLIPMTVSVGDTVVFEHAKAYGTKIDGVDYVTVPQSGVLAIFRD
jgi:chaperonin GroES